jgi:hypothetical protein
MNLKLIVLAIIATLLVIAPLVAATPMIGQFWGQHGTQTGNTAQIQNQQQLQTDDCTSLEFCSTKIPTNEVQSQNYACFQDLQYLQASTCTGLVICNNSLAKVVAQDNDCTYACEQECLQVKNSANVGSYNRPQNNDQCRNQMCQQECVRTQEIYGNCNDDCYPDQQQYSYSQQRQNHHGHNCR